MQTYSMKASEIQKDWYVVDADGQTLGRLATRIANVLTGKHKATYTPHLDMGDFVVVVNAEKVVLTGKKNTDKIYKHHSQAPGGFKEISAQAMRAKHPTRIIEHAVKGMLPNNKLRTPRLLKLKLVVGPNHPHEAQKPKPLAI
ncbi:MAG TPA: 50S ribosomal protein L13 [Candidatus Xenobia bacterium]